MKNLTTEELVKTYYQAMMEASEAGNHKEVLSLYSELSKASNAQEALIAVHEIRDEDGKKPFAEALIAACEAKHQEDRLARLLNKIWNTNIWKEEN